MTDYRRLYTISIHHLYVSSTYAGSDMATPHLMVTDLQRSVKFYQDVLDMTVAAVVSLEDQRITDITDETASFATLEGADGQLMLQTRESLQKTLVDIEMGPSSEFTGTLYFRGFSVDKILSRLKPENIIKGPIQQWYGMREVYFRDPDGYILCAGVTEGAAPA
ncbi:MAG: VOC family protein [Sneathiella sp.]